MKQAPKSRLEYAEPKDGYAGKNLELLPAALLGLLLFRVDQALAIIMVGWYISILAALSSAVKGVFTVVLYRYASTGALPEGFSARTIDSTLAPSAF